MNANKSILTVLFSTVFLLLTTVIVHTLGNKISPTEAEALNQLETSLRHDEWVNVAAVVYYVTSPATDTLFAIKSPILGLYGSEDARVNATIPNAEKRE